MNSRIVTEVSEVEFIPIKPRKGLIGFASCVVDGKFYIGGLGVHTALNGEKLRLTWPCRKIGTVNIPLCHPINREAGRTVEKAVTDRVMKLMGEANDRRA